MRANPACFFNNPIVQKKLVQMGWPPGNPDYEDYKQFMLSQPSIGPLRYSKECTQCAQV
jgi:hypothetical protein